MQASLFSRLEISNWRQFQSVEIEVHPKLTIITGANGSGKSTLLSFFAKHFGYHRNLLATPKTKGGQTSFATGIFDILKKTILSKKTEIPWQGHLIGRVGYSTGEFADLTLPAHADLNFSVNINGQLLVEGIHIDSHTLPNIYRPVTDFPASPPAVYGIGAGLSSEYMNFYSHGRLMQGGLVHIKMTLIQMSIFGYGNATMEPIPELIDLFKGFEEKLRLILPKSIGFKRLIIRSPEVLLSTHSGDFLIDAASGGVIKLIEVAWQLFFFSQGKGSFVITFDEPENHLHPSMQKLFIPNIISAFPNAQLIVVTHSPFIISSLQNSAVYVLRYEDAEIVSDEADDDGSIKGLMGTKVIAERLDTINKAGTASEILRNVLGITATIPDWAEDKISQIADKYRGLELSDDILSQLFDELEREGLASSYPNAVSSLTRAQ